MSPVRAGCEPLMELTVGLVALVANLLQFSDQVGMNPIVNEVDGQLCNVRRPLAAPRLKTQFLSR